jgi:exportin-2 (importin alpha re-exporter)
MIVETGYRFLRQLYTKLYPEVLQNSGSVESFVAAIWELLGGGKLPGVSDDHVSRNPQKYLPVNPPKLVAQALRFLSTTIRVGHYKKYFSDKRTISVLVEGVVVPNIGLRGQYHICHTKAASHRTQYLLSGRP